MAITKSNIANRLAETLVIDVDANGTPEDNVFSGTTLASKIYQVVIDNTATGAATYVRFQYATAYTKATQNDDPSSDNMRLYAPANQAVTYIFPEGLAFTTGLSFLATSDIADVDGTSYSNPSGTVTVKILGGT
tara:strand:+ start:479 stop:880 length:402 start_codon:yes stop_codon:yes gene_type:complete